MVAESAAVARDQRFALGTYASHASRGYDHGNKLDAHKQCTGNDLNLYSPFDAKSVRLQKSSGVQRSLEKSGEV